MTAAEKGFVHPEFVVETGWLAEHLRDPDVRILDCTTNLIPDPKITYHIVPARAEFEQGHVPARSSSMCAATFGQYAEIPLHDAFGRAFAAAMRRFGRRRRDARDHLQHRRDLVGDAGVVDAAHVRLRQRGGAERRLAENGRAKGPGGDRAGAAGGAGALHRARATAVMVGREEVQRAIGNGSVCTLNALSSQQHTGTGGTVYGRPGRIAGSVNIPAAQLLDPATNTLLPAPALREKFDAIGAFDKRVISYCGGGISATMDALALVMLGHPDVVVYDASMAEWANDPKLPMETG